MTGALDDLKVVEMGQLIAGPFCGQLLGDMGAEVIKIEPPGSGDPRSAHQSGDLVTADIMTGAAGSFPELASAVDAIVVLP